MNLKTKMEKGNYEVGQFVKVDMPGTYGRLVEVLENGHKSSIHKKSILEMYENKTGGLVIVVEYMKPNKGLMKETRRALYPLSDPFWANRIHVIDPKKEIQKLEQEKVKGNISEPDLEEIIKFLRPSPVSEKSS